MLRNKPRKTNIAVPFRIRNNFRRLPNRFLLSNNGNETMLQKDYEDDNVNDRSDDDHLQQQSDDDFEQRNLEQRSDDNLERRNNNEEGDVNMTSTSSESEKEDDYVESDEDYAVTSSESEREYDYVEIDEDYAVTSSDDEERYDADASSEEKIFVDRALAEDKLPSFDGDFAPYFQNLTTAALFCWIHKHNISTNAYEDLVDIIMKPGFNKDHIIKNILRLPAETYLA